MGVPHNRIRPIAIKLSCLASIYKLQVLGRTFVTSSHLGGVLEVEMRTLTHVLLFMYYIVVLLLRDYLSIAYTYVRSIVTAGNTYSSRTTA